jgi:ADP-heptose:LPS heptosyltransferase
MNIVIQPYSLDLKPYFGPHAENPKNYPYWDHLIKLLKKDKHSLTQIGIQGETVLKCQKLLIAQSFSDIRKAIEKTDLCLCIESFLFHMAHLLKKPCVVLWGVGDPLLFGYPEQVNLLKDRKYLRRNQFDINGKLGPLPHHNKDAFVEPEHVIRAINTTLKGVKEIEAHE